MKSLDSQKHSKNRVQRAIPSSNVVRCLLVSLQGTISFASIRAVRAVPAPEPAPSGVEGTLRRAGHASCGESPTATPDQARSCASVSTKAWLITLVSGEPRSVSGAAAEPGCRTESPPVHSSASVLVCQTSVLVCQKTSPGPHRALLHATRMPGPACRLQDYSPLRS
jgi:hypothetical protein